MLGSHEVQSGLFMKLSVDFHIMGFNLKLGITPLIGNSFMIWVRSVTEKSEEIEFLSN